MSIITRDHDSCLATRPPNDSDPKRQGFLFHDISDPVGRYIYHLDCWLQIDGLGTNADVTKLEQQIIDLEQRVADLELFNSLQFTD